MTALLIKSIIVKNELVNKFNSTVAKINSEDSGVTAVEYALIIGLIAIVIIAAVTLLGTSISDLFTQARCAVTGKTFIAATGSGATRVAATCSA
jgi:pilus assembly protein Flp/PilA